MVGKGFGAPHTAHQRHTARMSSEGNITKTSKLSQILSRGANQRGSAFRKLLTSMTSHCAVVMLPHGEILMVRTVSPSAPLRTPVALCP